MAINDRIDEAEKKVQRLDYQLREAREELRRLKETKEEVLEKSTPPDSQCSGFAFELPLTLQEYKRYGRQLIMPELGLDRQLRLRSSSVLIVGAGGLGCPAAAYLAGAGVGTIGVVDGDVVEESNLHRQILHGVKDIGDYKADSIARFITSLNPFVRCIPHTRHLTAANALETVEPYDLVLDCTDSPASRYLVSDVCVLSTKPLVSASALRADGQLMILNNPPRPPGDLIGGPCYRCIWPNPAPPDTVMSCGEAGILGPVVGTIGILMALEGIKLLSSCTSLTGDILTSDAARPPAKLLMFSALSAQAFRSIRLRGRRSDCKACSAGATIDAATMTAGLLDYDHFCERRVSVNVLGTHERISPGALAEQLFSKREKPEPIIVDVRETADWQVFSIPRSVNIPWSEMVHWTTSSARDLPTYREYMEVLQKSEAPIHVLCRQGNDSQLAVKLMKELRLDKQGCRYVGDVEGGWHRWRKEVPGLWPDY